MDGVGAGRSVPAATVQSAAGSGKKDVTSLLATSEKDDKKPEGAAQATEGAVAIAPASNSGPDHAERPPTTDRATAERRGGDPAADGADTAAGTDAADSSTKKKTTTLAHLVEEVHDDKPAQASQVLRTAEAADQRGAADAEVDIAGAAKAANDPIKPLPEGDSLDDPVLDERLDRAKESAASAEAAADALAKAHDRLDEARRDNNPGLQNEVQDEIDDLEKVAQLAIEEARANRQMAERYVEVTYGISLGDIEDRRGFSEDLEFNDIEHRIDKAEAKMREQGGSMPPEPPELPELPELPPLPEPPRRPLPYPPIDEFPRPVPAPDPMPRPMPYPMPYPNDPPIDRFPQWPGIDERHAIEYL
ncbi:MAG: hypothetical protein KDC46_08110 [Thermoleophilia bacterium]|nr:hypothetical protein [Thermoleophilia bacterium]